MRPLYAPLPTARPAAPGPVIAVIEDGLTGVAVARAAATLARDHGSPLLLVVPVEAGLRFSTDAAIVAFRQHRLRAEADAVVARVAPGLDAAGLERTTLRLEVSPGARGSRRAVDALLRLARRHGAAAIVTAGSSDAGLGAPAVQTRQWRRARHTPLPVVAVETGQVLGGATAAAVSAGESVPADTAPVPPADTAPASQADALPALAGAGTTVAAR